jgi:ATP-dependent helicase/nuclease subunit A
MNEELMDTILKDLYVDNYFIEEVSEKIRLFYVAVTRCREKMIIVTSLDEENNGYNHLVPYGERIKYRSFLDILNSIDVIRKYVTLKSAKYTHEYDDTKIKEITLDKATEKVEKRNIQLEYNLIQKMQFSKKVKEVVASDSIKAMEYGVKMHEIMEYSLVSDNEYLNKLFNKIDNNYINLYREYQFMYTDENEIYNGIIDLMVEYDDYINIIDYKLKNIDDKNYIKQLNGYKKYIESISDKKVNIYLYSMLDDELKEII